MRLQIHPVGKSASVRDRRLYFYKEKSEFRLNAGPLILGAKEGDLLVVERSRQRGIDYDATVVPTSSPAYRMWLAGATQEVSSGKRWGYS